MLLHSPHDSHKETSDKSVSSIRFLNLNRKITSLAAGSLTPGDPDALFVGTQNNLLSYNVDRNADRFFVELTDGANSLIVGESVVGHKPLIIAGGNCSILGFDDKGNEAFWTVTGGDVKSLALCDVDGQGSPALLVGADDYGIRVYRNEELITELTEADVVTHLCSLTSTTSSHMRDNRGAPNSASSCFAYAAGNNTAGVYDGNYRKWRVRTKHKVSALHSYDLDLDGANEVFVGWSNGTISVRRQETGEVIFKEALGAPIAGILTSDYRRGGTNEVLICSTAGEVRAYVSTDVDFFAMQERGVGRDNMSDQKALAELQQQKVDLVSELKLLEKSLKSQTSGKSGDLPVGALPNNTQLSYSLEPDFKARALLLRVTVHAEVQIVNLVAVDLEGVLLVDREVIAISPKAQSKTAVLPLTPTKNSPCSLRIQTHVAARSLITQLHVFEIDMKVPRFGAYQYLEPGSKEQKEMSRIKPQGEVRLLLDERATRLNAWLQEVFILPKTFKPDDNELHAYFVAVCDIGVPAPSSTQPNYTGSTQNCMLLAGSPVVVIASQVYSAGKAVLEVKVQCASMEQAADIVQDLARALNIKELESTATFDDDMKKLKEITHKVNECNAARLRLIADMADDSQRIKALLIRAEDSRLMLDMQSMRQAYTELNALNSQLVGGYAIRASNQELLLSVLKEVNSMIQKAANLRVGKSKQKVITDSRAAIKADNMKALQRIFKMGRSQQASGAFGP